MRIVESRSLIHKLPIHIVGKSNHTRLIWGSCCSQCYSIAILCDLDSSCVYNRSISVARKCSGRISQRYSFAHLQSHRLAVNAGCCVKLIYFFEHSRFKPLIFRLRDNTAHTADVARDGDRRRADKVSAKVGDGFPDEELRVKLSNILTADTHHFIIAVYSVGRALNVCDVFVSAPVVDQRKPVLLFLCQFALGISAVVTKAERYAFFYAVGDFIVYSFISPAELLAVIGRVADVDHVARRRLADSYVVGIEDRQIEPGFCGDLVQRLINGLAVIDRMELPVVADVAAVGFQQLLKAFLSVIGKIVGRINLAGRRDDLKVQVRTVCIAGIADAADLLAAHNRATLPDVDLRQMSIKRYRAVRVRDLHHVAVAVVVPLGDKAIPLLRYSHGAVICGDDRRTGRSADVPCAVLCAVTLRDFKILRHRPRVCRAGFGVDHRIVVNIGVCDRYGRCRGLGRGRRGNCGLRRRWDSGGFRSFRRFVRRRCRLRCGGRRRLCSRFRRRSGRCFRRRFRRRRGFRRCCGLRYGRRRRFRRRLCGRFHGGLRRWFRKVGRCYGSSPGGTCRGCLIRKGGHRQCRENQHYR